MSANSIGGYFRVNGNNLSQQYKNHLSDYKTWEQRDHAGEWVLFPDNIGTRLCIDEVALSDGELYTVLTNADSKCQKGSLIAMVKGVRSSVVSLVLEKIPRQKRDKVVEISLDMANNMKKIAEDNFINASIVTDRFHVAQLISESVQAPRIEHRWAAIKQENAMIAQCREKKEKYEAETFDNGDTRRQLLARSRHLLFKPSSKWTESQITRAGVLFREYPDLKEAYDYSMMSRNIYQTENSIEEARVSISAWGQKLRESKLEPFNTAVDAIDRHIDTILNFFISRTTNALAEAFNSKLKDFRSVLRGVRDVPFFLYRVSLIFG